MVSPSAVGMTRPMLTSDASACPKRWLLTLRILRSASRASDSLRPASSATIRSSSGVRTPRSIVLGGSATHRCTASPEVRCRRILSIAAAARCSTVRAMPSSSRDRYRLLSPNAWRSLDPRRPWPGLAWVLLLEWWVSTTAVAKWR